MRDLLRLPELKDKGDRGFSYYFSGKVILLLSNYYITFDGKLYYFSPNIISYFALSHCSELGETEGGASRDQAASLDSSSAEQSARRQSTAYDEAAYPGTAPPERSGTRTSVAPKASPQRATL